MNRITVSLTGDQHTWAVAEAERAGVSIGSVLRAVLDAARERGWQVEPQPGARVTE